MGCRIPKNVRDEVLLIAQTSVFWYGQVYSERNRMKFYGIDGNSGRTVTKFTKQIKQKFKKCEIKTISSYRCQSLCIYFLEYKKGGIKK